MKIRIGVGFAGWPFERTKDFWDFVDLVEDSGLDSIWLNDRIRNPAPALEPISGLAMIAGRTRRIKFGMSVAVLPVRDPLNLASELATIDFLSEGRMLPAFGLGVDNEAEWLAVGRTPQHRGAMTDEAVPLMRRLWSEDAVTHQGRFYHTHELSLNPKPHATTHARVVWRAFAGCLQTCGAAGRWLFGLLSAAGGSRAGRVLPSAKRQSNMSVRCRRTTMAPSCRFTLAMRILVPEIAALVKRINPRVPFEEYAAWRTPDAVLRCIDAFVSVGITKFVFRPMVTGPTINDQFARLAEVVVPRYHV